MAGENFERQEVAICKLIATSVQQNKNQPIHVKTYEASMCDVQTATKYGTRLLGGGEPYTDIVLAHANGVSYNVSCKGEYAPSLAGGGLKGIERVIPGLARSFVVAAHTYLLHELKLQSGDVVPNIYARISDEDKFTIAAGNQFMGGPLDFMYIGTMNVESQYFESNTTLHLNGKLIETSTFASSRDFYFRIRARRHDQRFEPGFMDRSGIPRIYGRSATKRDIGHRLVVTDSESLPQDALIIEFNRKTNGIEEVSNTNDRRGIQEPQTGPPRGSDSCSWDGRCERLDPVSTLTP